MGIKPSSGTHKADEAEAIGMLGGKREPPKDEFDALLKA